jgi:hypothetical protein
LDAIHWSPFVGCHSFGCHSLVAIHWPPSVDRSGRKANFAPARRRETAAASTHSGFRSLRQFRCQHPRQRAPHSVRFSVQLHGTVDTPCRDSLTSFSAVEMPQERGKRRPATNGQSCRDT